MLLNGDVKDTQTLALGNKQQKYAFANDVAALSGIDQAVILAALPRLAYAIEALLRTMKPSRSEASQVGQGFTFPEIEPWPEAVDGDALLEELAQVYSRYLMLPDGGATLLALWTLHTYVFDAFDVSPYLTVTSPQKRCGKSRVLMVASALCHAPLLASNATPAVMFRTVELAHPTLLLDEGETFVRDNEELRGIINSGHTRRTAYVLRTVGEEHEPRRFSTWTPKMFAAIGNLPETIRDRSIILTMHRKKRGERVVKWREREVAQYADLPRRCVRWARDHAEALAQADPPVPELLNDRATDNWATLLAIADQAGEAWRQRAEKAITALTGGNEEDDDDNAGLMLLADLRRFFTDTSAAEVASAPLVEWLLKREERPWAIYGKAGKPLTQRHVATLLRPFGIRPKVIRTSMGTPRGYTRDACAESFARYLPSDSGARSATAQQASNEATQGDFRSATAGGDVADEKTGFTASNQACCGVADRTPPGEGEEEEFTFDPETEAPFTPDDPIPF
jgi:hypothetical protein